MVAGVIIFVIASVDLHAQTSFTTPFKQSQSKATHAKPLVSVSQGSSSNATNVTYFFGNTDSNSQTWFKAATVKDASGKTRSLTNIAYIELATGMNYRKTTNGRFLKRSLNRIQMGR